MPGAAVLDWGCGIGRVAAALAPRVGRTLGVDLSAGMIGEARQRCAGLANVDLLRTEGGPLDRPAGAFDLVLAVDSLPFLHRSGAERVDAQIADFARLLVPGGRLLVFNWSYRGDDEADRADAAMLAARHGFSLDRGGERPFRIWDGAGFLFTKR